MNLRDPGSILPEDIVLELMDHAAIAECAAQLVELFSVRDEVGVSARFLNFRFQGFDARERRTVIDLDRQGERPAGYGDGVDSLGSALGEEATGRASLGRSGGASRPGPGDG